MKHPSPGISCQKDRRHSIHHRLKVCRELAPAGFFLCGDKFKIFHRIPYICPMEKLKEMASRFALEGEVEEVVPLGAGLINDSYRVKTVAEETPDYVLQRINHAIFQDVDLLQENIRRITEHIRRKLEARGERDTERKTLTVVPAKDGKLYVCDGGTYWRMTVFIRGSRTYEQVTPELAYLTGKAFGEFQDLLSDLPGEPLGATIPDFHNTAFRLEQLREAADADRAGRLAKVRDVVEELKGRAEEMCLAERLFREGKLPKRITHCDTKVNNMLFDEEGRFLCVIDLDTTMPGFVLSDFGDFIRTAGNKGAEDDEDLSRVRVNMEVFREFSRGYAEGTRAFLTPTERELLPYGAQMLTYMQTVRFLTDYLNGDTYYKIKSPEHNYQRTLAQLTLLHDIDAHLEEMKEWIKQLS